MQSDANALNQYERLLTSSFKSEVTYNSSSTKRKVLPPIPLAQEERLNQCQEELYWDCSSLRRRRMPGSSWKYFRRWRPIPFPQALAAGARTPSTHWRAASSPWGILPQAPRHITGSRNSATATTWSAVFH